jgi:tubulin polyglutamylase TTLL9
VTGSDLFKNNIQNDEKFNMVDSEDAADVIMSPVDFKRTTGDIQIDPEKHLFNQFPYESVLVMKHTLADCLRNIYGRCDFFQESFYSYTHLPAFIGRFRELEKEKKNNTWIMKPINSARSSDHVVSNNLDCIIRHVETAPRLIQKYISNPFLIDGKKIDLRFWVVVRSFSPLELYIHEYTYARISSTNFDSYETSMMDWTKHFGLKDKDTLEYNKGPEKEICVNAMNEHEEDGFDKFEKKVHQIVKDVFKAAVLYKPEIHDEKCRAIYGIDVIPDKDLNPYLLECTFQPELTHHAAINPNFISEVCRCMFLREDKGFHKLY